MKFWKRQNIIKFIQKQHIVYEKTEYFISYLISIPHLIKKDSFLSAFVSYRYIFSSKLVGGSHGHSPIVTLTML